MNRNRSVLAVDASPYGVGATLMHVFADGSQRPIAFASKTLSKAQRNYSQLDCDDAVNRLRFGQIPNLPLWQEIHDLIRPQTAGTHPESTSADPDSGGATTAKVGNHVIGISV